MYSPPSTRRPSAPASSTSANTRTSPASCARPRRSCASASRAGSARSGGKWRTPHDRSSQLQTNLVDAATRQRRRRRVRRVTARVAVAAALLAAFPLLAQEIAAPDPEVTAPTPTPTAATAPPKTVEEAFGVFRVRPATKRETPAVAERRRPSAVHRRPTGPPRVPGQARRRAVPGRPQNTQQPIVCNQARAFISGEALLMRSLATCSPRPCRTRSKTVRITTPGSKPFTLEPAEASADDLRRGPSVSSGPDPTARRARTTSTGVNAATSWGRFWDVERPANHLDDLPGARRIVSDQEVDLVAVPRRDAVCLVVRAGDDQEQRLPPKPRRHALPDRRVGGAPDRRRVPEQPAAPVRRAPLASSMVSNALLIRDGDYAVSFAYRDGAGPREMRLPEQKDFVCARRSDVAAGPHAGIGRPPRRLALAMRILFASTPARRCAIADPALRRLGLREPERLLTPVLTMVPPSLSADSPRWSATAGPAPPWRRSPRARAARVHPAVRGRPRQRPARRRHRGRANRRGRPHRHRRAPDRGRATARGRDRRAGTGQRFGQRERRAYPRLVFDARARTGAVRSAPSSMRARMAAVRGVMAGLLAA